MRKPNSITITEYSTINVIHNLAKVAEPLAMCERTTEYTDNQPLPYVHSGLVDYLLSFASLASCQNPLRSLDIELFFEKILEVYFSLQPLSRPVPFTRASD
jgi:hypothetical protein